MAIEFLLEDAKREIDKLNNKIKEIGIVKKPDERSMFLKKMMVEAIRARHHAHHVNEHMLDKNIARSKTGIRMPSMINQHEFPKLLPPVRKQVKREIPFFKPQELQRMQRIPEKKKRYQITEREYPLYKIGNYTLVRALINGKYKIVEPGLTDTDLRIINDLKLRGLTSDNAIMTKLKNFFSKSRSNFSNDYFQKIKYYVIRDDKLGKLYWLLRDSKVGKITCSGVSKPVTVSYAGKEMITDILYAKKDDVNNVVLGLARLARVNASEDEPLVDNVLPNGVRIQALLGGRIISPRFVISK